MAMNPKVYNQQIDELGIDGLVIDPSSLSEATNLLIELKRDSKVLQQIKYNIRMDIRKIRKEYLDKLDSLNDPSTRMGIFDKKLTDKELRHAKKRLLTERDSILSPYDGLERLIDYYLNEIDSSILLLKDYIHEQVE